jgi:hypothetical protein
MDELTFPRPDDLTDEEWATLAAELEAYADLRHRQVVGARTFSPHVVAHTPVVEDEPGQEAVAAKDRVKRTRDTVADCPDCTRGLVARNDALVCIDLLRQAVPLDGLTTTHHDVIACGRT